MNKDTQEVIQTTIYTENYLPIIYKEEIQRLPSAHSLAKHS